MPKQILIRLRLVIIKNEKLLCYYDSVEDYFFFVGGKLDFGETILAGCKREVKEELGENATFDFKKILYVRDFFGSKKLGHSLELYILGETNVGEEIEGRPDPEFAGKKWPTWIALNTIPDNLYPKKLTQKIIADYKTGFKETGEYVGEMD